MHGSKPKRSCQWLHTQNDQYQVWRDYLCHSTSTRRRLLSLSDGKRHDKISERALLIALAAISVQKVCQPQGSKPPRKNCVVLRYQSCKLVKQSSSWVTPLYEDKFQSNTIKPVLSSSIRILAQIQELRK